MKGDFQVDGVYDVVYDREDKGNKDLGDHMSSEEYFPK
jgi:hypothetical protein